jgi:hypothetical protein
MKGADHTHHMEGTDHTLPMTGVGHTTHVAMVTATVRDLPTVTEGGGHIPMVVLFHHTTAGALLLGTEDAAILQVCRHARATRAAALQYQKNRGAVLRGKDMTRKSSNRAAGHQARDILGKAMLTAAAPTRGLFLGSAPAHLAPDGLGSNATVFCRNPGFIMLCSNLCCAHVGRAELYCLYSEHTKHKSMYVDVMLYWILIFC